MPTTHGVGFAGEAAVAGEFSIRGYIVSLPMVDLGTDLYVENPQTGRTWRIQVKTATEKATQPGYFQFGVKEAAIHSPTATADHFAFVARVQDHWKIHVVPQAVLSKFVQNNQMGSLAAPQRTFTFILRANGDFDCSGQSMAPYAAATAWNPWPVI